MTDSIWIALIGLAGVAFGSLGMFLGRRKLKAEAAQIVTDAAVSLIEPLQKRLDSVELELEVERETNRLYRRTLEEWRGGIDKLIDQLCEVGLTPAWKPTPVPEAPTKPRKAKKHEDT